MAGWLRRLGLDRPELRAWVLYDWANSVFTTTILQVFPIFFHRVAASGLAPSAATARFGMATAISMLAIAVLSPMLGAYADRAGVRKRMLGLFMAIGALSTVALASVGRGQWLFGAVAFLIGNIGWAGSLVFYDSLLPHLARPEETDRVSTTGFSLGYLGGGLLLVLNFWMIERPGSFGLPSGEAATRVAFASAGVWWLLFSLPLLLWVPEPRDTISPDDRSFRTAIGSVVGQLGKTAREIRRYRHAFLFLIAFLIYSDGIGTIIRMATAFGTEIGIRQQALIAATVVVQFVGVPCSLGFGALAARIGARPAVLTGLGTYVFIAVFGYFLRTGTHFMILAVLVGMVMGGTQALSRSLFSSLVPKHRSSEFFAFYGVFDKLAGVVGPALFALMASATGSSRPAILALVVLFVLGAVLLVRVDIAAGQRAAREASANAPGGAGTAAGGC